MERMGGAGLGQKSLGAAMLAIRIIPLMLVRGRHLVKGRKFAGDRVVGHALQAAKIHAARSADEVCILDIAATREGRGPDLSMVEELTADAFVPISVGGGIRSLQDIDDLLRSGADKIVIGQAARDDPWFVAKASDKYGSQAIVVSVDHHAETPALACFEAKRAAVNGCGEILLQNTQLDGLMTGFNLELIRAVCGAVAVPVIASGGFGEPEHALQAVRAGASAVGIGAALQFSDLTPKQISEYLKQQGIEVRL